MTEDYVCFEVFVRSQNGLAYKHSSRLHAIDAHHALMLARDCYSRRNEAKSLWVIQSDDLHQAASLETLNVSSLDNRLFEVFMQFKSGLEYVHIASIWAESESIVFEKISILRSNLQKTRSMGDVWVCEAAVITALQCQDKEHFFDPMRDKKYRFPTFYTLPDAVNHM